MEFKVWQQDDSDVYDSGTSDDGMHDENCAGCLRIVKAEEERLRVWPEGARSGGREEKGLDLEGEQSRSDFPFLAYLLDISRVSVRVPAVRHL